MECQSSDSKKLFKVFDASKRKRIRKKREGLDDTNSVVTDDSTSVSIIFTVNFPNAVAVVKCPCYLQFINLTI